MFVAVSVAMPTHTHLEERMARIPASSLGKAGFRDPRSTGKTEVGNKRSLPRHTQGMAHHSDGACPAHHAEPADRAIGCCAGFVMYVY